MSGALGNLDLQTLLSNIKSILIPFTQVVLMICFVSGIYFIFKGVAKLRTFGQSATAYSSDKSEIVTPIVYLLIGVALIHIPQTTNIMSFSIFGAHYLKFFEQPIIELRTEGTGPSIVQAEVTTQPLFSTNASSEFGYISSVGDSDWAELINILIQFIQFIGFVAFVRGWFILANVASGHSGQQGGFSKGLVHVIGGVTAINFIPFMKIISGEI